MPHRENGETFRPPDLAAWPRLELHEELAGGARRRVYRAMYGSTDVVGVLARVHAVTRGWPQRPGIASAQTLLHTLRGRCRSRSYAVRALPGDR